MMHRILLGLWLCLFPAALPAQTLQTVSTNGVYQPHRPHSIGVFDSAAGSAGKTFVTWAGAGMDVWVRAYDHASSAWEPAIRIRDNSYTFENAYHNYPTLVVGPDGRVHVFFFNHNSAAYQLTAPTAHSLGGSWSFKQILQGDQPGYPTPVVAGGNIYLFFRHTIGDVYRTMKFAKSTDNGASWSATKTIITTGDAQPDNLDTIYPDDVGYEPDSGATPPRIRLTWHLAGGAFNNQKTKNAYLAYLRLSDEQMVSASGAVLGGTIDATDFTNEASNKILALQALPAGTQLQAVNANIPSRAMANLSNRPILAVNSFDSAGALSTRVVRWDGTNWITRAIPGAGAIRDIQQVSSSSIRVLKVSGSTITLVRTGNWGDSWTTDYTVSAASQLNNGADAIAGGITLWSSSSPVDFMFTTFRLSTRTSDYTGQWNTFVLKD
jgi:hypothetical protein